jgi:4-cresol dehydrogenase (hydroxylating)
MAVPPGVSESDFARALDRFRAVVGSEWVFTSDEDIALYKDAYSPLWGEPEEKLASAAIAPDSAEQVQEVVKIANEFHIPLYTVSTGRNLAYGGSAPVLSGSVVLDLKRMNRILEIDEKSAFALVEPGVSYFDLFRYIRDNKLKLWIDCPDPGWGSVTGNALDHGIGYTTNPYRDHWDAHCGLEVVTASGELIRTGMGALPNAKSWQHFKYGYGPLIDGIFSQSNFGIVTKMGIWLMPEPESFLEGRVRVTKHDDIIPLIEHMKYFMNTALMNCGTTNLSSPIRGELSGDPDLRKLLTRDDAESIARMNEIAAERNIPFYSVSLRFYGPETVLRAQWDYAKQRLSSIPGVSFEDGATYNFPLTDEQLPQVHSERELGIPSLSIFSIGTRSNFGPGSTGHLGFSPAIPMTGEAILESMRVIEAVLQEYAEELGTTVASTVFPQSYHQRTLVILVLFRVVHDPAINQRTRDVFKRLVSLAAEHGWGEYRTHTAFMDTCAAAYSFNDHSLLRFQETLKDAVDPNGILSAGRYGIWPKHIRDA